MLRWALDVRPGSKAHESKVERLGDKGVRLQAWNRLPQTRPTFPVTAQDLGLNADGDVLRVSLTGPAYRQPVEVEVTWEAERITVKTSKPVIVRLYYPKLRPGWPAEDRPTLQRRLDGRAEAVRDAVWEKGYVEWQALTGEYEVRKAPR
jgi:hypothetical protein